MKTWLGSLLLTVAAVTPAFAADDPMAIIKRLNDQWAAAYNKEDPTALAKLYASNATLLPPEVEKPITGNQNIEKYFAGMLKQKLTNLSIPVTDAKEIDPKSFYVTGTWSGDAGQQHLSGLWLNVVQQEGADWKITADIWNMPPPPAAATGSTQPKQ